MNRDVTSRVELNVTEPADLVFAMAVAGGYTTERETFTATLNGAPVDVHEVTDAHGTRLHRMTSAVRRSSSRSTRPPSSARRRPHAATAEADLLAYRRPSRYAESDRSPHRRRRVRRHRRLRQTSWPRCRPGSGTRLLYVSGSSLPTDGAIQHPARAGRACAVTTPISWSRCCELSASRPASSPSMRRGSAHGLPRGRRGVGRRPLVRRGRHDPRPDRRSSASRRGGMPRTRRSSTSSPAEPTW